MARNYKRDRRGRFARIAAASRGRKIRRLTATNKRVRTSLAAEPAAFRNSPMGQSLARRAVARDAKIATLRAKQRGSRLKG